MNHKYIAVCPLEFQETLAGELEALGAEQVIPTYKAVCFTATIEKSYEIHLRLASASRLLRVIREGFANDSNKIFFQATKIRWDQILAPRQTFVVEAIAGDRGPEAPSSNQISKAIREALQKQFQKFGHQIPQVDLKQPDVTIVGYYHAKKLIISVDTSRKSLHKRGYKNLNHPAPIKEHIAAAILRMVGYEGDQPLWDPMCGSGTFLIEAAFIALNKAPLIHRKKGEFGFEHLVDFQPALWRKVQDQVRLLKSPLINQFILGSDRDPNYVEMSKTHALRARVEKHLEIKQGDFFSMRPPASYGLLVCNLPYGDRISPVAKLEELEDFYTRLGQHLKQNCSGWTAVLITAQNTPWHKIGLRHCRKVSMENGGIPCYLLVYELYTGSKKSGQIPAVAPKSAHDSREPTLTLSP